jgi:hypothetical protein
VPGNHDLNLLSPGIHRIEVRAVDEYGQVHEAARLIEVAG